MEIFVRVLLRHWPSFFIFFTNLDMYCLVFQLATVNWTCWNSFHEFHELNIRQRKFLYHWISWGCAFSLNSCYGDSIVSYEKIFWFKTSWTIWMNVHNKYQKWINSSTFWCSHFYFLISQLISDLGANW